VRRVLEALAAYLERNQLLCEYSELEDEDLRQALAYSAASLQFDHTNVLRRRGMERGQAILQASRDRLRPILMTTISFVAGLLPLLIVTGPGVEERRSIAVLVVGGQTLSLLLTLIAIPVLYTFFDDLTAMFWKPAKASASDSADASVHVGQAAAPAV
jgi:HAE1 family hydrophobic/amphiphilic exporter-1